MRWRSALAAAAVLAAVGAGAVVAIAPGGGGAAGRSPALLSQAAGWSGLVGGARAPVATGQRVLVVLSAFSLADRVARAGGLASDREERGWTAAAVAAQQQFIAGLGRKGVQIRPEFRFTRTLNGFSATLDPRAIALVERTPGVKGVYPVRVAYPATLSSAAIRDAAAAGGRTGVRLAGVSGQGVTVALLDTGVDLERAYLHGHVLPGIDVVGDGPDARAQADPADPAQTERHGTEMAGLIVGSGGPAGLAGVAPSATLLPIRAAGWQADSRGGYTVYARTDQLLAGLERAVDPNGDGDAHDAARVAVIPLVEPFFAFGDDPLARAADGAMRLDTLVVAAAGNDGPAGPAFGSVGGPAGAGAVLAVGAADARRRTSFVRVVVRAGLSVLLDRVLPLAGVAAPARPLLLAAAAVRGPASAPDDFFSKGSSLVAGRAAVVPAGADPAAAARYAADAGAAAVLLHGRAVAPGGIGLDQRIGVPVVAVSDEIARALATRRDALVAIAAPRSRPAGPERIAPFSSWGLAFDGSVKPELLASGVGLVTSEPGGAAGAAAFGTVTGSSAAAAVAAGAAALLAEARPAADARTLRALLVGAARPLAGAPPAAQGTGSLDLGRAAAAEFTAEPDSIAFGRETGDGWQGRQVLRVRNLSARRLTVFVSTGQGPRTAVPLAVSPKRLEIPPGAAARVVVRTPPLTITRGEEASGTLTLTPVGGIAIRVPWAVVLSRGRGLLGPIALTDSRFSPSEQKPAVVVLRAGRVVRSPNRPAVVPVLRLDVEVWTAAGKRLGLVARLRDLLPGRYAFGLTGRGPGGRVLPRGRYRLRVFAWPTGGGGPDSRSVVFTIR